MPFSATGWAATLKAATPDGYRIGAAERAARGDMGDYLGRLNNHLDASTLEATLGLMISEYRAAIRKQRELIGLVRLGHHDTSSHMNRLNQLDVVAGTLTALRQHLRARRGLARTEEPIPLHNAVARVRSIVP